VIGFKEEQVIDLEEDPPRAPRLSPSAGSIDKRLRASRR
jgi:hypothetical protein